MGTGVRENRIDSRELVSTVKIDFAPFPHNLPFLPKRKRERSWRSLLHRSIAFYVHHNYVSYACLATCWYKQHTLNTRQSSTRRTLGVCVYTIAPRVYVSFLSRASSSFLGSRVNGVAVSHWYIGQDARETVVVSARIRHQRISPSKPDCTPSDWTVGWCPWPPRTRIWCSPYLWNKTIHVFKNLDVFLIHIPFIHF